MEIEEDTCSQNPESHEQSTSTTTSSSSSSQDEKPISSDLTRLSAEKFEQTRKLIFLLSMNMLNFQRAIIFSRRRNQRRIQRRRMMMRSFYIRQLLETQTTFLELLPSLMKLHKARRKVNVSQQRQQTRQSDGDNDDDSNDETAEVGKKQLFYEDIVRGFTSSQWLNTFRVSQETFHWLCAQLNDALKPSGIYMPYKNHISLEKRVAMALYTCATGADYRVVAALFDVSRTSVCKYIKRFAESVIEVLGNNLLAMPTSKDEYDEIRQNFQVASNMPALVVGVLGLVELPVNPIAEDQAAYRNKNGETTLILQAIVDDKLLFRNIFMESKHPTLFFEKDISKLSQHTINGRELPCFVASTNDLYGLRPWLMRKYDLLLNPYEHDFNDAMDQLEEFKNSAFSRLFGRWNILHRKIDLEPKTMEIIATACCALHNLLEENGDGYMSEWETNFDISKYMNGEFPQEPPTRSHVALEMRDFLARTISSTEM